MGGLNQWLDWQMIGDAAAREWMTDVSFLGGRRQVEALYAAPAADGPSTALRDGIAAIIDPPVFTDRFIGNRRQNNGWADRRAKRQQTARDKADVILARVVHLRANPQGSNSVVVPPLTDEQRAYLEPLLRQEPVDMSILIGGPKAPLSDGAGHGTASTSDQGCSSREAKNP